MNNRYSHRITPPERSSDKNDNNDGILYRTKRGRRLSALSFWILGAILFLSIVVSFLLHLSLVDYHDNNSSSRHNNNNNNNNKKASCDLTKLKSGSPDEKRGVDEEGTTSACLCVMDDNHYLIEWIAYHYHTMNLRHLVITVDPDSLTHPKRVLDRWRDRIKIEVWEDDRFISQDYDATVKHMSGEHKDPKLIGHRVRQASFNLECLKHLKRENREWVIMLDTDEYLTMNPNLRDSDTYSYDLPGLDKPGSLFKLLDQIIIPNPDFDELNTPCIPVFRQQFAARESDHHQVNAMVPSGFHGKNFQTLRWRKYGYPDFWYETKWGEECHVKRWVPNKVLIDLGRIRLVDIDHPDNQGNPHRPLRSVCTGDLYIKAPKTPFAANHYMGTLEQWLYRVGDKRGQGYRLARYEDLNFWIGEHESDQLRPWLQGFVATIGENEASRLLDGVGILEPLPHHEKYIPKEEPNSTHGEEVVYHVGDVVQANYKGDGYWLWAEVSKVHSNGYYDVLFAEDCTEEIATFGARLRRKGKSDDALNDTEFQMLIHDRL